MGDFLANQVSASSGQARGVRLGLRGPYVISLRVNPLHRHLPAIATASESLNVLRIVGGITRAWRKRFMAALILCSNSTMVSFGHSRLRISSALDNLAGMLSNRRYKNLQE